MVDFLYPPHPQSKFRIQPESVERLEKESGWLAQRKYNGSHCVAHLHKGKLRLWNRHSEPFTTYRMKPSMEQAFVQGIDTDLEVVLNGELMHTKAKNKITNAQALTDTIILFDLLYLDGPLLTQDFEERYNTLCKLCGNPKVLEPKERALVVTQVDESNLWLAEVFKDDFSYRFYEMYEFDDQGQDKFPEIEGLVCKRAKDSRLKLGNVQYDVNWMMRVRKTKEKMYLF